MYETALNSPYILPVGIERIVLFSSAQDTDFYIRMPNQSCIPRTKALSQALLVNIVSFIELFFFIIVVFVLFCFLFSIYSVFALLLFSEIFSWESVLLSSEAAYFVYKHLKVNFSSVLLFLFMSIYFLISLVLSSLTVTEYLIVKQFIVAQQ